MFAGLMSRWIIPFSCAAASPRAISRPSLSICGTVIAEPACCRLLQEIFQRRPLEEWHGDERHAAVFIDLKDRDVLSCSSLAAARASAGTALSSPPGGPFPAAWS